MKKVLLTIVIILAYIVIISLSAAAGSAVCQYRRRVHNDLRVVIPVIPKRCPPTITYDNRLVYLEGRILQLGDRLYEDEQAIRDLELRIKRLEDTRR